jgi:hypothetical protein
MGVERINGSHSILSQFTLTPLLEQYPSSSVIQHPALLPSPSFTTTMVQTSSNNKTPKGVLSLKDIMQRPSLSPPMISTAANDIIYKTNTNGLWLEFPTRSNSSTTDRKIIEESRDEYNVHHSRIPEKEETLWSTLLVEEPQQELLSAHFHAGTELQLDEISTDSLSAIQIEIPKNVSFDTVEFDREVMNSDDSLFSHDDESDADCWSFATDPDASFEAFDDISILTQETLDFEETKRLNFCLAAVQDSALTGFLADFCSRPTYEE